jgi:uncharacterized protein involved in exopolysaccharide biosynthesis
VPGAGDLVALLVRRWVIWLPIFAVVLGISVYQYLSVTPRFQSKVNMLVSRGERESSITSRVRVVSWEEEIASEVQTVYSEIVRNRASLILADSGLVAGDGDLIEVSQDQMYVGPVQSSNVIEILFRHERAEVAEQGVAAIAEAYRQFVAERRATPEVDDYFNRRIAGVQDSLQVAAGRRQQILEEANLGSLTEQRLETVNLMGSIRSSLLRIRELVARQDARIEAVAAVQRTGEVGVDVVPYFADDLRVENDGGIRRLIDGLVELEARENELRSRFTDRHPDLREVRDQIAGQRILVKTAAGRYQKTLESELEELQARQRQLEADLVDFEAELGSYPRQESALARANLEIATLEDQYQQLIEGHTSAGIQNASAPARSVTLYSSPSAPVSARRGDLVRTLIMPAFALVVALGLAFMVDALDPSVKTMREAEDALDAPVLAAVAESGRR